MNVLEKDTTLILRELKEEVISLWSTIHQAVGSKAETVDLVAITEALHHKANKEQLDSFIRDIRDEI